ncbi:porin [Pararobbsia alpina]|uniref:Outer membrane porin protein n=1 Tax=Pararobbsia alpina TaxID=621374 RepID=A0A6S7AWM4_9BURK|nr:porin [Pararobbsia alpina]CAB3780114.1 Outer membrane porin protein [Pararobbsia alpina]
MTVAKKSFAAATLLGAFVSIAHAQSTVTLYGVLDESLQYLNSVNNGGKAGPSFGLANSANNTTVFGLKGSEDLGGGMHAVFKLESQFGISNGANSYGTDLFNRQSWVGIQDDRWGTVTIGKQYSSLVDSLCPLSAYCTFGGNMSAHVYDNDNVGGGYTVSNAVKYASPVVGGWHFSGMYAFSNAAGQFANNRLFSFGVNYDQGPLHLGAAYQDGSNPASATNSVNGAVGSNMASFAAGDQRVFGAGARVDVGKGTVGVLYTHSTFLSLSTAGTDFADINGEDLRFDNYSVYGRYPVTGAFSLGAGYTLANEHLTGSTDATLHNQQVTIEGDYSLSARTTLYVEGAYQHISGGDGISLSYAVMPDTGMLSATNSQTQIVTGIRHIF